MKAKLAIWPGRSAAPGAIQGATTGVNSSTDTEYGLDTEVVDSH